MNFYVTLTKEEMAAQVAALLNSYNRLTTKHTMHTIMYAPQDYFIEVYGNIVAGCAAILYENNAWSKIKHVSTRMEFRRRGIARKLIQTAMKCCHSENVYMTIRADNNPSLSMAQSLGFVEVKREWIIDHYLIAMGRKINDARSSQASW